MAGSCTGRRTASRSSAEGLVERGAPMTSVPLSRPALPRLGAPLEWPGRVMAVFGPGDLAFARAVAKATPARLVIVELRHAAGHRAVGEQIHAHPDALLEALDLAKPAPDSERLVIGVGPAFALAVRASPLIWITGGQHPISLPPALREIATRADLALERARPRLAEELAAGLAARTDR